MKLLPEFRSRSTARGTGATRHRSGTVILALGMLVLIIAQLSWWLIFFQRNQTETIALQRQLDRLRIAAANGELAPGGDQTDLTEYEQNKTDQSPLVLFADGRYGLAQEELARREASSRRAFFMLVSETLFVIVVCSYGTFRVMRTILREGRLRHERQIFIDSVTHELKTPLASILLNLQTILKRDPPQAGREELIQDSISDVRRLEEQLNNILLSGRLGRRHATDDQRAIETTEAVAAIRNFFQENAKRFDQAGLQFSLELPDTLNLGIDLDSFRTILSNLLQNTIQYAGATPPVIQIKAQQTTNAANNSGRHCFIYFQDAGPGIPREEWENVFQPFYRLQEGQRPVRGSGMGLYLVRELARTAGGDVRIVDSGSYIENSASGREQTTGALIELRLPAAQS